MAFLPELGGRQVQRLPSSASTSPKSITYDTSRFNHFKDRMGVSSSGAKLLGRVFSQKEQQEIEGLREKKDQLSTINRRHFDAFLELYDQFIKVVDLQVTAKLSQPEHREFLAKVLDNPGLALCHFEINRVFSRNVELDGDFPPSLDMLTVSGATSGPVESVPRPNLTGEFKPRPPAADQPVSDDKKYHHRRRAYTFVKKTAKPGTIQDSKDAQRRRATRLRKPKPPVTSARPTKDEVSANANAKTAYWDAQPVVQDVSRIVGMLDRAKSKGRPMDPRYTISRVTDLSGEALGGNGYTAFMGEFVLKGFNDLELAEKQVFAGHVMAQAGKSVPESGLLSPGDWKALVRIHPQYKQYKYVAVFRKAPGAVMTGALNGVRLPTKPSESDGKDVGDVIGLDRQAKRFRTNAREIFFQMGRDVVMDILMDNRDRLIKHVTPAPPHFPATEDRPYVAQDNIVNFGNILVDYRGGSARLHLIDNDTMLPLERLPLARAKLLHMLTHPQETAAHILEGITSPYSGLNCYGWDPNSVLEHLAGMSTDDMVSLLVQGMAQGIRDLQSQEPFHVEGRYGTDYFGGIVNFYNDILGEIKAGKLVDDCLVLENSSDA